MKEQISWIGQIGSSDPSDLSVLLDNARYANPEYTD